uniref:Uncharacterized protein n=1 Tax=Rhizophora mucronata TaxID=61149 RepID=A0A2P2QIF1_RHIMU
MIKLVLSASEEREQATAFMPNSSSSAAVHVSDSHKL